MKSNECSKSKCRVFGNVSSFPCRRQTALATDERVKLMNEIISGMRVIKMYCWEKPFGQLVEKIRMLVPHSFDFLNTLMSTLCLGLAFSGLCQCLHLP